jgi:hypothetical protein
MREPAFQTLPRPQPMALAGKRVLVLGLGDTGLSVVRWVATQGALARVADTRAAPPRAADVGAGAEVVTGKFAPALLDGVGLLCISPGLSLEEPVVREALARKIPIVGDIELFAWDVRSRSHASVLAITGTNGKTTVTALTAHLLRSAGIDSEAGGNIGPPRSMRLRSDTMRAPAAWVLELSSYQLETDLVARAGRRGAAQRQRRPSRPLCRDRRIRGGEGARLFRQRRAGLEPRRSALDGACAAGTPVATFGLDAPEPSATSASTAGGSCAVVTNSAHRGVADLRSA